MRWAPDNWLLLESAPAPKGRMLAEHYLRTLGPQCPHELQAMQHQIMPKTMRRQIMPKMMPESTLKTRSCKLPSNVPFCIAFQPKTQARLHRMWVGCGGVFVGRGPPRPIPHSPRPPAVVSQERECWFIEKCQNCHLGGFNCMTERVHDPACTAACHTHTHTHVPAHPPAHDPSRCTSSKLKVVLFKQKTHATRWACARFGGCPSLLQDVISQVRPKFAILGFPHAGLPKKLPSGIYCYVWTPMLKPCIKAP